MYERRDPSRQAIRESLHKLGIDGAGIRALLLLPLVYVAWADGKMDRVEVEKIRQIARDRLHLGSESEKVLERWLTERPSRPQIEEGLQGLADLAFDEEVLDIDVSELPDLMMHSEAIARATGEALNEPLAVSPEENRALKEIAEILQVDGGDTWEDVLEDLRSRGS
jgi:hypothetical protein